MPNISQDTCLRDILFRARSKKTGEWVEGSYVHTTRKGEWHNIIERESNEWTQVYRESLQMMDWDGEYKDIGYFHVDHRSWESKKEEDND